MSDVLVLGGIVLLGCLIGASAVKLRRTAPWAYWTVSGVWIAAIFILLFVLGGRGSQNRDVFAAAILVVAFPVLVTFVVARRTTSGLWLATALASATWLTALFVGVTLGLSSGLIPK